MKRRLSRCKRCNKVMTLGPIKLCKACRSELVPQKVKP